MVRNENEDTVLNGMVAQPPRDYSGLLRLFLVWVSAVICGGVTPGINLFIPQFAQYGLFAEACNPSPPCKAQTLLLVNVFAFEQSLVSLGFLPAGMLFDLWGGRLCAFLGSLGVGIGALLVLVALSMSSATALGLATLLMDTSNLVVLSGFTGLMWHLPYNQGLLFSLSIASTTTAAVLPVILNYVMATTGLSFFTVFMVYAGLTASSSLVMLLVVPSQADFLAQADYVLGIPVTPPPPPSWKSIKSSIYMGFRVVNMQRRDVMMYTLACALSQVAGMAYSAELVSFATELFGNRKIATQLADFDTESTTVLSVVGAILSGYVIDHYSIGALAMCTAALTACMVMLNPIEDYDLQRICSVANRSIAIFMTPIGYRYIAYWAPSHRYGMVQGLVSIVNVAASCCLMVVSTVLSSVEDGSFAYILPTRIFGVCALLVWSIFAHRLTSVPMPSTVLLEGDEEEMMWENFGLKTFEDAEAVLKLPRREILRLLASQDLSERRKLIDLMKEPEVQVRWAQQAYSEGYELPDMDLFSYAMLVASDLERTLIRFACCDQPTNVSRTPRGKSLLG